MDRPLKPDPLLSPSYDHGDLAPVAGPAILAFDIGGTRIKAGVVRGSAVSGLTIVPTQGTRAGSRLETVITLGRRLMEGRDIAGVGLCVKGIVEPAQGILLEVNDGLADWVGRPIARMVADRLGRPVRMENDARMYALGEFVHGAGRRSESMVCLTLGTGVGSGVALAGRILRGPHGTRGIMCGQVTIQRDGLPCSCGNIGCLETLVGTAGVIRSAEEVLARTPSSTLREGPLDPHRIFAAAALGDRAAQEVVHRFATDLGAGVVTVIHAYDPDVVVLGGGMSHAAAQFVPAVQGYATAHAWTSPRGRTRILPALLGDAAALVGVAEYVRDADRVA
jgi:glucokinase